MAIRMRETGEGVQLALKVVPGAKRARIVGELGDALKVAVSKPPADGAANRAVMELLAAALGVPAAQVEILRGHSSPRKEVLLRGITAAIVQERLNVSRESDKMR